MNNKILFFTVFVLGIWLLPHFSFATHQTAVGQMNELTAWIAPAQFCGQTASASVTYKDEPHRLLKSISAGGTVIRDDTWAAHISVNGLTRELYRYGKCGCSDGGGCSGTENVWWLPIFQDSGAGSPDTVIVSGEAVEQFKTGKEASDVGFSGYQTYATWALCHDGQITNNGSCEDIFGSINSDQATCDEPCAPTISWSSQYAADVVVKKNGVIWSNESNSSGIQDSGLTKGTYTYVLYGNDGFGMQQKLGEVSVPVTSAPVSCAPASPNVAINSPVTIKAKGGTPSAGYSWLASGGNPSSGAGESFTVSYNTPGTKTVNITSAGSQGQCAVEVTIGGKINIKANSLDGPITVPDTQNTINLSWGPVPSNSKLTNCFALNGWSGNKSSLGSEQIQQTPGTTKVYEISCKNELGSDTSDSVSVTVSPKSPPKPPKGTEECVLTVSSNSIEVNNYASWTVTSEPSGYSYVWKGTNNGADIGSIPGTGPTNNAETYYYTQPGQYYREAVVNFPNGPKTCSGGTTFFVRAKQQSCSLSVNKSSVTVGPGKSESASWTVNSTPPGYNYVWKGANNGRDIGSIPGQGPTNRTETYNYDTSHAGTYTRAVEIQLPGGICRAPESGFIQFNVNRVGQSGGGQPPPPEEEPPPERDSPLTAATDGHYQYPGESDIPGGTWTTNLRGNAPLTGVDLKFQLRGGALFYADLIEFDCTNDGNIDGEIFAGGNSPERFYSTLIVQDLCSYPTPGTYTATAKAWRSGWSYFGGWQKTVRAWCFDHPCDENAAVTITVAPPPEQFNFDDALWNIRSTTPRYRADYDYDNNAVLDRADRNLLGEVAINLRSCPQNKTCDINGSGSVNSSDTSAYSAYLKTYEVYEDTAEANNIRANVYLSSNTGANVNLSSNAPSGYSIAPSSVNVPKNGSRSAELRMPSSLAEGSYSVTITGVAGGGTTKTTSPMVLTVSDISILTPPPPPPPPPVPDFGLNKSGDIFANIIGTQPVTSSSANISVSAFDGFANTVNLSVESSNPALSGAVFNFSDPSLSASEYVRGSSFSVTIPSNTPSGVYALKLKAANGGLTRNIDVRLNVNTKDPSFKEI